MFDDAYELELRVYECAFQAALYSNMADRGYLRFKGDSLDSLKRMSMIWLDKYFYWCQLFECHGGL